MLIKLTEEERIELIMLIEFDDSAGRYSPIRVRLTKKILLCDEIYLET